MATTQDVTETTSSWDPYERGCLPGAYSTGSAQVDGLVLGERGKHGACRFTHLRKGLSGVSEKMLTQTLRALERDGLVHRTVYPAVPVRVEYALTSLGRTLREPLKMLTEWSVQHIAEVLAARGEYDARAERVS